MTQACNHFWRYEPECEQCDVVRVAEATKKPLLYESRYCDKCQTMTNHDHGVCPRCGRGA